MPWLLPLVAVAAIAPAPAQPPTDKAKSLVKLSLLPHDSMVKPGDTVQVGVVLDVAKDWHLYWPGQNDSGTPVIVKLSFPPDSGLTVGAVSFPRPKRLVLPGDILDYVLDDKVVITVPVKVPVSAVVGRKIRISAAVEYLVCHDSCIPGEDNASANLVIADKTDGKESNAKTVDEARAAQPRPQAEGFAAAATAAWEGQTLVIAAKEATVTQSTFYPSADGAKLLDPIKSGQVKGKTLRLTFEPGLKPVDGVVEFTTGNAPKAWSFHLSRPAAEGGAAAPKPVSEPSPNKPRP